MTDNSQHQHEHITNQDPQSKEELLFDEVGIFYNFVFDLGDFINPTIATRKLLETDISLSAANYLTDDIEVAARFKELNLLRSQGVALSEIHQYLKTERIFSTCKWILQHPRFAWRLGWTIITSRGRIPREVPSEQYSEGTFEEMISGTIDFMDESMLRIQLLEALHRHVDRLLFRPQYLRDVPFTRIGLQPFFATLGGEPLGVDVWVSVHRSGVAILTFGVEFNGQKSVDELVDLQLASVPVENLEVVRALVEVDETNLGKPSEQRSSSGVDWFTYQDLKGVTLADVFEMYQAFIIPVVLGKTSSKPSDTWSWLRNPFWHAYPIVFIRKITPDIYNAAAFKQDYPKELAGLVTRFTHWRSLTDETIKHVITDDLSIVEDHSLYIESSHTTVLYYEPCRKSLIEIHGEDIPGQEWIFRFFQTSSVIDVLLIQRGVLSILSNKLRNLPYNTKKLNALKRDAFLALEEFHNIVLLHGSAHDIVKRGIVKMGIDEELQNLLQKLGNIERLIEVNETQRRANRDLLLKFGAIIATVMFGLSGAWQVVETIKKWDDLIPSLDEGLKRTILETVVQAVQAHPIELTLEIYFILVLIILSLLIWSLLPSHNRKPIIDIDQSKPAYTPGFIWPHSHVEITGIEPKIKEDNSSEQDTTKSE